MKKTYTLFLAAFITITSFAQPVNYPGNSKTDAGGVVGLGSLDLSNTPDMLHITFNKGGGSAKMDKALVIYIMTAGVSGVKTTQNLHDTDDLLTKAICGFDGTGNRAVINFAQGFRPAYAIAFLPGDGVKGTALVVRLVENPGDSMQVKARPGFDPNNNQSATAYDMEVKLKDIGIDAGATVGFRFMATYISPETGRTAEAIGDAMTDFAGGWLPYTQSGSPLDYNQLLPAVFNGFTGSFAGKNVQLNWNTATEINTKQFDVQKSGDGTSWRSIGTVAAQNVSTGARYSYLDNNVSDATTYYQIKLTDNDGATSFSPVIVMRKDGISGITLMGNPARGVVNLNINNNNAGKYNIELYSIDGRRLASQVYNHPGGSGKVSITVPGAVKGTCIVKVSNGTEKQTMKVVVE